MQMCALISHEHLLIDLQIFRSALLLSFIPLSVLIKYASEVDGIMHC